MLSFRILVSIFSLLPAVALAVPGKNNRRIAAEASAPEAATTTASERRTLSFGAAGLEGASVFAAYDLTDSIDVGKGTSPDIDRTLMLGAQYEMKQFSPGVAMQAGGTYEFEREVKNSNGLKYRVMSLYGEVTGQINESVKLLGGLNYNFPSLYNAGEGASVKGKTGYQIGASVQVGPNFALLGRYRSIEMEVKGRDQFGQTTSLTAKAQGLMMGASYLF